MESQETVFCSTGASSSSQGLGTISVHDFQTGTLLASFKQTCADVHSTAVVPTRDGEGGFVLAAQPDKSILNAYYLQKDQVALKMVLPERLSCIDVDAGGNFCAAGTSEGRIYLWEIASGILFNAWNAHYRRVSVIRFTQDSAALLSGSDDSGVSVWLVSSLLDNTTEQDIPTSYCALPDHTLPITDIICGVGNFPFCRALTSSMDHSVKLWDIASKTLLTTFAMPGPIHSLALDKAERFFFAASAGDSQKSPSHIHNIKLYHHREERDGQTFVEAFGGTGTSEVVHADSPQGDSIRVNQKVSCLALSMTQSTLLVGTGMGEVQLYDVASHQLLRSFTPVKDKSQGLAVTHIACFLKPPDLIGNISLGFNVSSMTSVKDVIPTKPIQSFQRVRDTKARSWHEVSLLLHPFETTSNPTSYPMAEILEDQERFSLPRSLEAGALTQFSHVQLARVEELEAEIERLRLQLSKAKGVNDAMWEAVVNRVLVPTEVGTQANGKIGTL